MNILAIIPARGGSKGLPGKNIKPLLNHPLIAYSILAAQQSNLITRITVNTDDDEIAAIAKKYGAEIVFMRPPQLAEDFSTDFDVFSHQLNWMKENENYIPDYIVQLRPTSPVRYTNLIDTCITKLIYSDADSLRVVTESPLTPYKMWTIEHDNESMKPLIETNLIKEAYNQPRQHLPKVYWQTGTVDVMKTSVLKNNSMSGKKIIPHIIDKIFAIDIDDIESFTKAEKIINYSDCIKFDR